ncbi:MAG: helix-turn-helix transcriptional regulator [Gemmatimonadota bacterium]|nr:MAG: helix-turn-helix transcriptional regulator [Gemmatimonadota bacterium]
MSRHGIRILACRSPEHLHSLYHRELVDAVVVDVSTTGTDLAVELVDSYPGIPLFALSSFRPGDGLLLARCRAVGFRAVLVQGVDDTVASDLIAARGASRIRRQMLGDATRLLRLSEPLQLQAWDAVLKRVGSPTRTSDIAAAMRVTREHLSREFAAGGAPNLKRVIDLVRTTWAADLLSNPGYDVSTAANILRFSSASHLAASARRVAGVTPSELAQLGPQGVLRRFLAGRMRSRL